MARRIGIVIMILAVALAAQRVLVPFDLQTASRFDGEDVLAVMTECGRAAYILLDGDAELAGKGANFSNDCEKAARTRALEAFGLVVIGGFALWVSFHGRLGRAQPIDEVLPPLPSGDIEVWGRGRSEPDRGADAEAAGSWRPPRDGPGQSDGWADDG